MEFFSCLVSHLRSAGGGGGGGGGGANYTCTHVGQGSVRASGLLPGGAAPAGRLFSGAQAAGPQGGRKAPEV